MSSKYLSILAAACFTLALPSTFANAGHYHGECCVPAPSPTATKVICLKDPCDCCTYKVSLCIPACCCTEEPCVTWRRGFLGRKIATIKWKCCGHCVEVVVTRRGKVIVRD